LEIIRNNVGEITNETFSNTFGAHLGVLYSSSAGDEKRNVFAPVLSLSTLDFQLGIGYEAGTVSENQKRAFFTVSYAIPLYKLVKTGYRVLRLASTPIAAK
jgi:hypothetical protein